MSLRNISIDISDTELAARTDRLIALQLSRFSPYLKQGTLSLSQTEQMLWQASLHWRSTFEQRQLKDLRRDPWQAIASVVGRLERRLARNLQHAQSL